MAITHTPMVIMVLGRGVRVTGVMVDGGKPGFRDIGGIADSTFFGRAISDPAFALHFVNGYFFYFNLG